MTKDTQGCSGHGGAGVLERPRFFPRQLVTPDDLTLAQDYLREKMRRMIRDLHGWGVVCGAKVAFPNPLVAWKVVIQPGYVLGPYGDEILLDRAICFDLRNRCYTAVAGDPCSEGIPTPCGGQTTPPRTGFRWIAVRYKEFPSRPVRVQPAGCGCDETSCEYSRWRDGYEICVLDACPESHSQPPVIEGPRPAPMPACPPYPSDPWVVLARVNVDARGTVLEIDNCSCRRVVVSMAGWWVRCNDAVLTPPATDPRPPGGPGTPTTPSTPNMPNTPGTPGRPVPQ